VVTAPRATYTAIAAAPHVLDAMAVVALVCAGTSFVFLSTEVGREALLDRQLRLAESLGIEVSDEQYAAMQAGLDTARDATTGGTIAAVVVGSVLLAALVATVFGRRARATGTYRQVLAVVVHSELLLALQRLLTTPLNYTRGSMSSPTNLAVFFPMLDELSLGARLLGTIDLFWIWWLVNLSIGIAVLYRRPAPPIALALVAAYGALAAAVAAAVFLYSGA
jgi:hypothetical protein